MKKEPLSNLRVLDFSTLLPGPLATLYLVQAGAEVIKIESPEKGDPIREYPPLRDGKSILFELLNRGKHSVALNLKDSKTHSRLLELIRSADILVEQFRPGVMERLELDYCSLRSINPGLIYCSITGYGQLGSFNQVAGHDLNYQAWTGLLDLIEECEGKPLVPPLIADIAGGAHPAVINILLALIGRDQMGFGACIDIAMIDGLFPFMLSAIANWLANNSIQSSGADLLTGGSPRYQLYRTSDCQHLAVAALEDRFWQRFVELIGLPPELRSNDAEARLVRRSVAEIIQRESGSYWQLRFKGEDVCSTVVRSLTDTLSDPDILARNRVDLSQNPAINLLSIPANTTMFPAPIHGEHNNHFGF